MKLLQTALALILCVLLAPTLGYAVGPTVDDVRVGSAALAFSSGYIRMGLPVEGVVTRARDERWLSGTSDLIYIQLARPQEVSAGDIFTVYRSIRKVFHPLSGAYLGDLISVRGVARVVTIAKNVAAARVVRAYDSISQGEAVMRFSLSSAAAPSVGASAQPTDNPGVVVDVQYRQTLLGQFNIVYVDLGLRDGLQVGDTLEVVRTLPGLPPRSVGELRVLSVEERTATTIISRATENILRGDRIAGLKDPTTSASPGVPVSSPIPSPSR
jgi:chemotaxis protein MotB